MLVPKDSPQQDLHLSGIFTTFAIEILQSIRMKHINTVLFTCLLSLSSHATTITYTADNTTNFPNPERGFYEQVEQIVKTDGKSNLSDHYFTDGQTAGRTLLLRLYYLENFRTEALPEPVLTQIGNDMAKFRSKGFKCILRFAYTASSTKPYQDASPQIWEQHLKQLKPVLQANADVIYVVQAGFLGVWGEWYYSGQGTGYNIPESTRTALINQLLDAVPSSRCVQVRTPKYKTDFTGDAVALTSATAWKQDKRSRIGHHNDAFCNGAQNMGTYEDVTADKAYLAQECLFVPNGGETNIEKSNASNYKNYGTGEKAAAEMKLLHYSYLNYDYSDYATGQWKTERDASGNSYYDIMARQMGYRFQLIKGTYPEETGIERKANIELTLRNTGYAPIYNARKAYIVLQKGNKTYSTALQTDPRTWRPGETISISETITLPEDIETGTYDLYLHLPDADSRIAGNPQFAIRFANSDMWEESTGRNNLHAQIRVTNSSVPVDPIDPTDPTQPTKCHADTIIRLSITGKNSCTVDGSIGGTGAVNQLSSGSPYKLNKTGAYIMMELAEGNHFQEGDTLVVDMAFNQTTFWAYSDNGVTELVTADVTKSETVTRSKFVLPQTANGLRQIWICRTEANRQNGKLTGMEVHRTICKEQTGQPDDTHQVAFDNNRPKAWDTHFALTPSSLTTIRIAKDETYTIPDQEPSIGLAEDPSYLIYHFTGWNAEQDGTGTMYQAGDMVSTDKDITLYAQWEGRPFGITYYADAAQTEPLALQPDTYTFDKETVFPTPQKEGYDFTGWHSAFSHEPVTSTQGYYGDFVLYAEWKAVTPTAIDNTESKGLPYRKYVHEGRIVIEREGVVYDVLGKIGFRE